MTNTVLLFDMDGVLVEPRRYRAALQGTLDLFGSRMGWESLYPGESTIAWFESQGIISEWDIAPLYLAQVFETILNNYPEIQLQADLFKSCEIIKSARVMKQEIQIEGFLDQFHTHIGNGKTICDVVFDLVNLESQPAIFNNLSNNPLFGNLLLNTRDVYKNTITRVFQEMFLGKTEFESAFGIRVLTESQSACEMLDRQIISPDWIDKLTIHQMDATLKMAIYTARPSFLKNGNSNGDLFFSPEADIVARQLGWEHIPLVGQGQLSAAARKIGCDTDALIKPSPIHALGAISMAMGEPFLPAVLAGWNLNNKMDDPFFDNMPDLHVHVFEDSPTGIRGVQRAADLLIKRGLKIEITEWGIASDQKKKKSLIAAGAIIRPTINEALEDALKYLASY